MTSHSIKLLLTSKLWNSTHTSHRLLTVSGFGFKPEPLCCCRWLPRSQSLSAPS